MKTERENSHKDTKALRKKRDNYLKTSCLRALVAKNGFTLPELLTAIAIIVILIGVLMPALAQVKKLAKETKQKAQLGSIDVGVILYKNDFGEYPPSNGYDDSAGNLYRPADYVYCGAQTLAEAMFGQDL
ncbi:MAG: type II secretion system GspH family protein, partial [Sedimentisphaerales bacterium]|nr:type II secretion system GspH family protein [Sedimentisphaerales bacterium]